MDVTGIIFSTLFYWTPIWLFLSTKHLVKLKYVLDPVFTVFASLIFAVSLYSIHTYPFFFLYSGFFALTTLVSKRKGFSDMAAFLLAIYAVFAVSELWEIPIHLRHWFNIPNPLADHRMCLSPEKINISIVQTVLKLTSIPFFFHQLKVKQWKPSLKWFSLLAGSILIMLILEETPILHIYRIPWFIVFLIVICETKQIEAN